MSKQRWLAVWTALALVAFMTHDVSAQNGGGSTPNGRPFQQIQSQFADVHQRILGLQTQVASVEAGLQAQIDSINAALISTNDLITSLDDALASIHSRLDANEATIAALEAALGSLQAALVATKSELATLQAQVALYGTDTAANTAAILALQAQVSQMQSSINSYAGQISALQGQAATTSQFLANLANGTCAAGQAIGDVGPQGTITCIAPGGGTDLMAVQMAWNFAPGTNAVVVNCPLGYKAAGGGYDSAFGVDVVGSFPTSTAWVVRVHSTLPSITILAYARCVK